MKKIIVIMIAFLFIACQGKKKKLEENKTLVLTPTFEISPPIATYEPAKEVFSVDNSMDTVLISEHGSFINIPADCFKDQAGNKVEDVNVEFTEYTNPADILFSGIPMEYVTEEGNETFQSAGMCDINAFSNGEKVLLADGKAIDIGLKNQAQDSDYNLYYFDKRKGEWVEKEKNLVVDNGPIPVKPVSTKTIDSSRVIHVDVNHSDVSETYSMWDQSNFYMLPGQEPKYAKRDVFWYDMSLLKTTNPDVFVLKLNGATNGEQVLEVLTVQPLISPGNYEKAMKAFRKNMRAHAKKLIRSKKQTNKNLLSAEETMASIEKEHRDRKVSDSLKVVDRNNANELNSEVMRTFQVNQLGLYNCDRFYARQILATKQLKFEFNGDQMKFQHASLCSPSDNAVLTSIQQNDGTYTIDFSSGNFYFVGIKGSELYNVKVNAQTREGSVEVEPISKTELEKLMI